MVSNLDVFIPVFIAFAGGLGCGWILFWPHKKKL